MCAAGFHSSDEASYSRTCRADPGAPENESIVLSKLPERDRDAQTERSLEPEWLVAEILFGLVHERRIHSVLVGGIASSINEKLKSVARVFELAPRRLA